ncbi:MAG: DNA polymerase III subunit delta [Burkholderiaceae bacterium]
MAPRPAHCPCSPSASWWRSAALVGRRRNWPGPSPSRRRPWPEPTRCDCWSAAGASTRPRPARPGSDRSHAADSWCQSIRSSAPALPQWIANRLARQRQRADADTLRMIAERVEGNLLAAHQEIRKLGLLFEPGALPAEEAQEAVLSVARYGSFDLLEAALSGDVERTLRSLDGLRAEGEPAPLLLWALADGTRTLEAATEARLGGRPVAEVLRSARVFGRAREQAFQAAASRFTPSQVRKILQSAARTDRIVKGIEAGDEWDALLRLALALAGAPLPAEPAAR